MLSVKTCYSSARIADGQKSAAAVFKPTAMRRGLRKFVTAL